MSPFWLGVIAGYGIAIPVGAIAVLILDTGLQRGLRFALAAGTGAAAADFTYAALAVFVGGAIATRLSGYAEMIRLAGGLVLVGIGVSRVWASLRPRPPSAGLSATRSAMATTLTFFGLTLLNPLTIVYFAALILGEAGIAGGPGAAAAFAMGAGLASLSWQWLLAAAGALGGKTLPPVARRVAMWLGNLIVLGLGMRLIWGG